MVKHTTASSVKVIRVIWIAMVLSVVIYGAVLWATLRDSPDATGLEQGLRHPVVQVMYALAVVSFFLGFNVPRLLGRGGEQRRIPPTGASPAITEETVRQLIVQYALFEAASVFGLAAGLLTRDLRLFLPPAALSILGLLLRAPSEDRLGEPA